MNGQDPDNELMPEKAGDEDRGHVSRRRVLQVSVAGAVGVISAGGLADFFLRRGQKDKPRAAVAGETKRPAEHLDILRGDAPTNEVFEAWSKRGWVREARFYTRAEGNKTQCHLCPNHCVLAPGDRSHCRNRINRDGTLYTLAYANPCSLHVDPVEKKPLFHFMPGSKTFSLAASGCVFRCLNCQNWEISQKKPEETKRADGAEYRFRPGAPPPRSMDDIARMSMLPEDVVAVAVQAGCPSISYTYSEPIAWYEYMADICKLAREAKVRNIMVTCGSIEGPPLRELAKHLDAAHVDLKGFDDGIYERLNAGKLQPVLNTIRTLAELGVWFEVINLVVPTHTDNPDMIRRMCDWLVKNAGPDRPVHFSRFHPAHKLAHLPPTPVDTLVQAREAARAAGLRYVYIGNVRGVPDAETTFCPGCRIAVIERDVFSITKMNLVNGKCPKCNTAIGGVWA